MAKINPFTVGQTVTLKSGGSSMTIESFENDLIDDEKIYAHCVWQDKNKPYEKKYLIDVLRSDENDDAIGFALL